MTPKPSDERKGKEKTEYWLFWEERGYREYAVFATKKMAIQHITKELGEFSFPILIKGIKIKL